MAMSIPQSRITLNQIDQHLPEFSDILRNAADGKSDNKTEYKVNGFSQDLMESSKLRKITFPVGKYVRGRTKFKVVDKRTEFHQEYVAAGKDPLRDYDICLSLKVKYWHADNLSVAPRLSVSTHESISPALEAVKFNYHITGVDVPTSRVGVIGHSTAFGFKTDAQAYHGLKTYSYQSAAEEAEAMQDPTKQHKISQLANLHLWTRRVSKSRQSS